MAKILVIVESPAKAKTIERYLGKSHYTVKASVGHIRDLPKSKLGIDIENNFEPGYINIRGKGDLIKDLKKTAKKASKVYLATDPDREGEAISWHLEYILGIDENEPCRIEFHEITKDAIKKAIKNPRKINIDLVDAQQARRVIDRLLGYQISPVLWQKVRKGLSAGRVQSVTTKLICDREKEIDAFEPKEYWTLDIETSTKDNEIIVFRLHSKDNEKIEINSEEEMKKITDIIEGKTVSADRIDSRKRRKSPPKPFTTSVLQQEGVNRLGFSTKKTMKIAQELYEGVEIKGEGITGLVSYIRTDSNRLSDEAKEKAKSYILENLGPDYYGEEKKQTKQSGKKVQDAHEAIRPTSAERTPESIKDSLSKDQYKLYNLIWRRFIASQMRDSVFEQMTIESDIDGYTFRATGSKMIFDGYTKIYNFVGREDRILPEISQGDVLSVDEIMPEQHFTQPPARYTEASLVKTLEELGIGRPSTYAPTIATILNREYVEKNGTSLVPTELGKLVTDILEVNFSQLMDVDFTADLENKLDTIEMGEADWKVVVKESYEPFADAIKDALENLEKINMDIETDEICENCGEHMVIKYGRFGKFMACKNYPECKTTRPIVNKIGVKCPKCGEGDIILRKSKKGRAFYGCSRYPECDFVEWNKPVEEKCPECGSYMTEKVSKKETKHICSNKECGYEISVESKENE